MNEVIQEARDDDLVIWGAKAIGEEVNVSERKAFYLLERGLLSADKVGKQWVSTRRRLRRKMQGGA